MYYLLQVDDIALEVLGTLLQMYVLIIINLISATI